MDYVRRMLSSIREGVEQNDKKGIPLPKDEKFGETVKSLEGCVTQQMEGTQVKFEENSVYFYPQDNDMMMTFTIADMNDMVVNFKLNDPNGQGCYISCDNTQLNDENTKKVQQVKYAYDTWRKSIISDDSIISNIKSALVGRE